MQQFIPAEADREWMQATALSPRSLRLPSRLLRAASDERLVAALRRGDEKAFEEIYDRHHRALLGFCRHMLGSHEEAEDALQRVFVSAHRHLCEGSAHVNLKPWLYTIARNRCVSMLRSRRETLALEDVLEPRCDLALADEVELGEDLKEMLGDIARLPDNQRAALVLAELGDLSQQEIAAILDVRTDKVKALIFQAREALAGSLTPVVRWMTLAFGWFDTAGRAEASSERRLQSDGRARVRTSSVVVIAVGLALGFALSAAASERPRYDVPTGHHKCREVAAWNGFFKWVSVRHTTCRRAQRFLRAYATTAERGPMPRRVRGFRCAIRYWRNEEGDIYASRHRCARGRTVIRFYGMV